jgi:hypothetical protein
MNGFSFCSCCCHQTIQLSTAATAHGRDSQLSQSFESDRVYLSCKTSEQQLYQQEVSSLVDSLYEGVNAALLAYGECDMCACYWHLGWSLLYVLKVLVGNVLDDDADDMCENSRKQLS